MALNGVKLMTGFWTIKNRAKPWGQNGHQRFHKVKVKVCFCLPTCRSCTPQMENPYSQLFRVLLHFSFVDFYVGGKKLFVCWIFIIYWMKSSVLSSSCRGFDSSSSFGWVLLGKFWCGESGWEEGVCWYCQGFCCFVKVLVFVWSWNWFPYLKDMSTKGGKRVWSNQATLKSFGCKHNLTD